MTLTVGTPVTVNDPVSFYHGRRGVVAEVTHFKGLSGKLPPVYTVHVPTGTGNAYASFAVLETELVPVEEAANG
jgi:hypothetical protein